jgi:hypothetical protein
MYLNLTLSERRRFDRLYTSVFFTHAATQPVVNAEKLLALMKSGIVEVHKLGNTYRLVRDDVGDRYEFIYRDDQGNEKNDVYRYVIDARGQAKSLETNPSALAKDLLDSGLVQTEEIRPNDHPVKSTPNLIAESENPDDCYKTGSIWIDPETFHVMQFGPGNDVSKSNVFYAVGAVTRGQIIDASMARGIVLATSRIADDLIKDLY